MVTWSALLSILVLLAGIALTLFGMLMFFAAGMSDAPDVADKVTKQSMFVFFPGLALIALAIFGLSS